MRIAGKPKVLEQMRMVAARMFADSAATDVIASAVDRDDQTIRRWRREWKAGGVAALVAKKHPGPEPKLNDEQWQKILLMLAKPPSEFGFESYLWTAELIGRLIQREFNVGYSHDYVGIMLRRYCWSPQRPALVAREKDLAAIRQWIDVTWRDIVKKARENGAIIVFVDEAGFSMVPCVKSMWAPIGQTPVVKHRNRWHRKVSVIGAIAVDLQNAQSPQLLTDWYPDKHVQQEEVGEFLTRLTKQFEGRNIMLVWDKLAAHRGSVAREFIATHPQLTAEHFPSYAPELNPVEQIWSLSKYHKMANHGIEDLNDLHKEAEKQVNRIGRDASLLCKFIKHTELGNALYQERAQ